jgi:hypothetical protein
MGQQIKLNQFAHSNGGSGPSQLERRDKHSIGNGEGQNVGFHPERSFHNGKKKSIN